MPEMDRCIGCSYEFQTIFKTTITKELNFKNLQIDSRVSKGLLGNYGIGDQPILPLILSPILQISACGYGP